MDLRLRPVVTLLCLLTVIAFVFSPTRGAHAASLADLNAQLAKAQADLARYQNLQQSEQNKSQQYQSQIDAAKSQINQVQNTIASLGSQISTKESAINDTQAAIDQKIKDINTKNDQLNKSIVDYYIFNNSSDLSVGAVQSDLSHYADQAEYLEILHKTIDDERAALDAAKQDYQKKQADLQQQRNDLAVLKGQAEDKNADLVAQKNNNVALLNQSQANLQAYQASANQVSGQIAKIRRQIDAAVASSSGGTGGYPYANWTIDVPDPWGEYTRECTSYASWYWATKLGKHITDGSHHGNAEEYGIIAHQQGFHTTSSPSVAGIGAIVMWPNFGGVGHVAIMTGINSDGTIDTAEYNSYGDHNFHTFSHLPYGIRGTTVFIY